MEGKSWGPGPDLKQPPSASYPSFRLIPIGKQFLVLHVRVTLSCSPNQTSIHLKVPNYLVKPLCDPQRIFDPHINIRLPSISYGVLYRKDPCLITFFFIKFVNKQVKGLELMILRRQRDATKRPHTYALKQPRLMCISTREFRYPPCFLISNIHEILHLGNPK